MLTIKIKETDTEIVQWARTELEKHYFEVLKTSIPAIQASIRKIIISALINEPEYIGLLQGRLLAEFGLVDASSKLNSILGIWAQDIHVTVDKFKLKVEAIQTDMDNVIQIAAAHQVTEKGEDLPWLDWLMLQGDKTIIRRYEVRLSNSPASRTGRAIMVQGKISRWHVPSDYAGNRRNNWATRAIEHINDEDIYKVIQTAIQVKW